MAGWTRRKRVSEDDPSGRERSLGEYQFLLPGDPESVFLSGMLDDQLIGISQKLTAANNPPGVLLFPSRLLALPIMLRLYRHAPPFLAIPGQANHRGPDPPNPYPSDVSNTSTRIESGYYFLMIQRQLSRQK